MVVSLNWGGDGFFGIFFSRIEGYYNTLENWKSWWKEKHIDQILGKPFGEIWC